MHVDPELLGLLALGESVGSDDERAHVQSCPQCAGELSELRRLVDLGRSVGADTTMSTPSRDVWVRIQNELALDQSIEPLDVDRFAGAVTFAGAADAVIVRGELSPAGSDWSHARGRAEIITDERGRRLMRVALDADLPTSGIRQSWLVHRHDPTQRQTLGILDGPNGLWTVEHSIDLDDYAILDISQQEIGQTEHSGQSIVRGQLAPVG